ncbi:High mobility group B protein 13 [Nymphon striatum]|nr:High mobility group B protein 13 [Nymphon striatum]
MFNIPFLSSLSLSSFNCLKYKSLPCNNAILASVRFLSSSNTLNRRLVSGRPRRPPTPYLLFRSQNADGKMWTSLDTGEKQVYVEKYKQLMATYQVDENKFYEAWSEKQWRELNKNYCHKKIQALRINFEKYNSYFNNSPKIQEFIAASKSKPKKAAHAYMLFSMEMHSKSEQKLNAGEIAKKWLDMPDKEKEKYQEIYRKNKEIYQQNTLTQKEKLDVLLKVGLNSEEKEMLKKFSNCYYAFNTIKNEVFEQNIGSKLYFKYAGGITGFDDLSLVDQHKLNKDRVTLKELPEEEKKYYMKLFSKSHKEYIKILNEFHETLKNVMRFKNDSHKMMCRESNKPKPMKPILAYFYSSERSKNPSLSLTEALKIWKDLSEEKKTQFTEMRNKDLEVYKKEMAEWKKISRKYYTAEKTREDISWTNHKLGKTNTAYPLRKKNLNKKITRPPVKIARTRAGNNVMLASVTFLCSANDLNLICQRTISVRPRRPPPPNFIFLQEYFKLYNSDGKVQPGDVVKRWLSLDEDKKQVYCDKYKELMKQYKVDRIKYYENLSDEQWQELNENYCHEQIQALGVKLVKYNTYFKRSPNIQEFLTVSKTKKVASAFALFSMEMHSRSQQKLNRRTIAQMWLETPDEEKEKYEEIYQKNKLARKEKLEALLKVGLNSEENKMLRQGCDCYYRNSNIFKQNVGSKIYLKYAGGIISYDDLSVVDQRKLNKDSVKLKELPEVEKEYYMKLYSESREKCINILNKFYETLKMIRRFKNDSHKMMCRESNKPKGVKSSFSYFYHSERSKNPFLSISEAHKMWKNLSVENKTLFSEMRNKDLVVYKKEIAEWKKANHYFVMVKKRPAFDCENGYQGKEESKTYHRFPLNNPQLFKRWVKNVG